MVNSVFIEDLFVEFYDFVSNNGLIVQQQDWPAATSFYSSITSGRLLTRNQGNFLMKLLMKYKGVIAKAGFDYTDRLDDPQWKNDFRVLDLSKKLYVEKDSDGELWICAKFPYSLKDVFNKEVVGLTSTVFDSSKWDNEERVRRLRFYDYNLIATYEFAMKHEFEIDDSVMEALGDVEEIWQRSDDIVPMSVIVEDHVELVNAIDDAQNFFNENKSGNVHSDLLLAKAMGFPYIGAPQSRAEKIANSTSKKFWIKTNSDLFALYKDVGGPVAIVLDRGSSSTEWVKTFYQDAISAEVDKNDIRVCFRLNANDDKDGFNQWVKDVGLGGPVDDGKIYIFQQKPPKWLFSKDVPVKIIVTNSLYPLPSNVTQTWIDSHSCVCFVGEIKASRNTKDNRIVEL